MIVKVYDLLISNWPPSKLKTNDGRRNTYANSERNYGGINENTCSHLMFLMTGECVLLYISLDICNT